MSKIIRDGMVAVLYSPGFGAGWSSWGDVSMFEPELVEAVEAGASPADLVAIADRLYPDEYNGGAEDLTVMWLPAGTHFRIHEYDGSERVEVRDNMDWIAA